LPNHGTVNAGVPSGGIEARFGPLGSPFADRFFSITIRNNTIYQTTADGTCKAFATFDGGPWGLAFSRDGSRMLVVVRQGALGAPASPSAKARIVSVNADGVVDRTPVYEHSDNALFDVEVAPPNFGAYGGQMFFTDFGVDASEGPDKPPKWDGALYRVGPDGKAHLVASGFSNPSGIAFAGNSIWVSDINRDGPFFPTGNTSDPGNQWVPDGFLVRIDLQRAK
jgi:sugar lactone lactonase YvrE